MTPMTKCPHGDESCLCQYCETWCKKGVNCTLKTDKDQCDGGRNLCTSFTGRFPNDFKGKSHPDGGKYCYLCGAENATYYEEDNAYLCPDCARTHPITETVWWR